MITAFTLAIAAIAAVVSRIGVSYETPLSGCAFGHGTGDALGLVRWANRLHIDTRPLEVPIWEPARDFEQSTGNCVLTMGNDSWSPAGADLEDASWLTARDWLARGNTLIVVTVNPESLPRQLRRELIPTRLVELAALRERNLGDHGVNERPETAQAVVTTGWALTVSRQGPRWKIAAPVTAAADAGASDKGKGPVPLGRQTAELAQMQLAGDSRGGVLFRIPVGRGAVYILLDDFAWTNTGLDQGDNARILAEILAREVRGGSLWLDEYRHGHGRSESFLSYFLNLPGASALMWLGAIWALLVFYGLNVRLEPVETFEEAERRTSREYIDALAQLYERARAAPLVVEAVARRLRQVSRSTAETPAAVESLLEIADTFIEAAERPGSPTAGIHLVTELIQLRKEMYGTRAVS